MGSLEILSSTSPRSSLLSTKIENTPLPGLSQNLTMGFAMSTLLLPFSLLWDIAQ